MKLLKRLLRALLLGLVAIVLLFEEWGWDPLAKVFARLARLPLWAWVEREIAALPRWGALMAFGVPMLALLPVKLFALYLFSHGQPWWGVALLIAAKVLGTAVLARLFYLTQATLLQFAWFGRWYPRWKTWKDALLQGVRQSKPWRTATRTKERLKTRVKAWWSRVL